MREFTVETFLAACRECYHYRPPFSEEPVYRWFVLDVEPRSPEKWANEAIAFLEAWGAYHPPIKDFGLKRARDFLPRFLKSHRDSLKCLDGKYLQTFAPTDFELVHAMSADLLEGLSFTHKGRHHGAQTATGKLLHFLLPHGVMMWDDRVVRQEAYDGLGSTATDFVNYQMFGKRVLLRLLEDSSTGELSGLSLRHSKDCGLNYVEPLPKLLDEMAYDRVEAQAASRAVGSPKEKQFPTRVPR